MNFEKSYRRARESLKNSNSINKYNRNLFEKFFDWEEEKLKRQNNISKLDESSYKTLYGYISKFNNVNKWFKNKAWNTLTEKEIRNVYNDLEDGKIKTHRGVPFKDRRSYYNKIFKAKPFLLAGLRDDVDNALEFFTDKKKREVRFVSEESFKRMVGFLRKPQHFVLFWLAWDIGENVSALLELRKNHLKRQINPDTKEAEYLVYLPKENLKRSRETRSEPTVFTETVRYLDSLFEYGKEIEYRDAKTGQFKRKTIPFKDDDFLFSFKYRQAFQIFESVVKRSGVKCEPSGDTPTWKDLRSGMACNLFSQGWHVEDINLRLGHSPQSNWLNSYINYLAINRKRVIKQHYQHNLQDVKEKLEEVEQREKGKDRRVEEQQKEIQNLKTQMTKILEGINGLMEKSEKIKR